VRVHCGHHQLVRLDRSAARPQPYCAQFVLDGIQGIVRDRLIFRK
jgi:hypothetical protein